MLLRTFKSDILSTVLYIRICFEPQNCFWCWSFSNPDPKFGLVQNRSDNVSRWVLFRRQNKLKGSSLVSWPHRTSCRCRCNVTYVNINHGQCRHQDIMVNVDNTNKTVNNNKHVTGIRNITDLTDITVSRIYSNHRSHYRLQRNQRHQVDTVHNLDPWHQAAPHGFQNITPNSK
jgi:hypothetical protein